MNEDAHAIYMYLICSKYHPEQFVFVDESSCNCWISHKYGCAIRDNAPPRKPSSSMVKGSTAHNSFDSNQHLHYHRFSVLPAISLDRILTVKIVEGSYDSDSFARFIDGLLYHMNPFPGPNSIIVMDNC